MSKETHNTELIPKEALHIADVGSSYSLIRTLEDLPNEEWIDIPNCTMVALAGNG